MGDEKQTENERLQANIDAFRHLLGLANQLRGTNSSKWSISQEDWGRAIYQVLNAPEGQPSDAPSVSEAIRLVHKIARRLGNSGNARFASVSVRRHPDSSIDGRRFYKDLETADKRLNALQTHQKADDCNSPEKP